MAHVLEQGYDWVLWHDADTLVADASVRIESLVAAAGQAQGADGPDLIVTEDAGGVNAGVWLAHRSAWTAIFLERWWAMRTRWARPRGDTKSGDNDALKALLAREARWPYGRVGVLPQCAFNSYVLGKFLASLGVSGVRGCKGKSL